MNDSQANTEQRELLPNELKSGEATDLAQAISGASETTTCYENKQLLLDEIEGLKNHRDKLLGEAEQLYKELAPLEALLESDEIMDADRTHELQRSYDELKRPYDSLNHQASIANNKIHRREKLINYETLMADYTESMANWKTDEKELNEKRDSLSTRLEQIQKQATEDMAKARQAETDAATAYAQAVAWGGHGRRKKCQCRRTKGSEKSNHGDRAQSSPALDYCRIGARAGHSESIHRGSPKRAQNYRAKSSTSGSHIAGRKME